MIRLLTKEDFIDVYTKLNQRGLSFIASKFSLNKESRISSAFNTFRLENTNWWDVPAVQTRWNKMISGDYNVDFRDYLINQHLKGKKDLKVLSLGSGTCQHELYYAGFSEIFTEILCVDLGANNLQQAQQIANDKHLKNIHFKCEDIYKTKFKNNYYDLVVFHASLHHFSNLDELFKDKILPALKVDGCLFINEYVGVNRFQFPKKQIQAINKALNIIPDKYKVRSTTSLIKNKFYGNGWLRVYLADPSESVSSEDILNTVKNYFNPIDEKSYGGNILMNVFKDIAYNFVEINPEKQNILNQIFTLEDEYLKENKPDFIIGLYQKKQNAFNINSHI